MEAVFELFALFINSTNIFSVYLLGSMLNAGGSLLSKKKKKKSPYPPQALWVCCVYHSFVQRGSETPYKIQRKQYSLKLMRKAGHRESRGK